MSSNPRASRAFIAPFFVFMALLAVSDGVHALFKNSPELLLNSPKYWVFPLQTVLCGALLVRYWSYYRFGRPKGLILALAIGLLMFVAWIAPQQFFGVPRRVDGFNPNVFTGGAYAFTLFARFVRLVIVVPLLEEIFWRGFLLRYLENQDFDSVSFGSFAPVPFGAVAILFALAHSWADLWPALLTGVCYNLVACTTRSLSSCVAAHALTNLLLGIYILYTGQWGFW